VLHAESNAIAKLARSSNSGLGATLFVTHSPCIECSKLIHQSGIFRVYYSKDYRDSAGVDFLRQSGVEVEKFA
jgi:dCMP deaminase